MRTVKQLRKRVYRASLICKAWSIVSNEQVLEGDLLAVEAKACHMNCGRPQIEKQAERNGRSKEERHHLQYFRCEIFPT